MSGWIGVDFDGTLAEYGTWVSPSHCGRPIAPMVERVKTWLAQGREVRIFTARIHPLDTCVSATERVQLADAEAAVASRAMGIDPERFNDAVRSIEAIRAWCIEHIGRALPITNVKDYGMVELYDDRCVQVRPNTGELVGQSTRGLE